MKKPESKGKGISAGKQEEIKVDSYSVSRVRQIGKKDTVVFDLEVNGIKVFGCIVVEGKEGDFISFPSRKGSDGKYYSYVYVKFSDKDQADILAEVERQLNSAD